MGKAEKDEIYRRILRLGGVGILSYEEAIKTAASVLRVLEHMMDGQWHDADSIRRYAGTNGRPASEGLRRLRELRPLGFQVERRRCKADSSLWEYQLRMADDSPVVRASALPSQGDLWFQEIP
jgi:hypothetical protein